MFMSQPCNLSLVKAKQKVDAPIYILINLWTHTVDFRLTYFVCSYTFSIEFLMDNASNMVSNRPQTHSSQCNYKHRHVPTLCRVEGIGTHLECPQIKVTILSHRIDAAKKA